MDLPALSLLVDRGFCGFHMASYLRRSWGLHMRKIISAVFMAIVFTGCSSGESENQVMPAKSTVDAVYAPNTTEYLRASVGTPRSKSLELTFWHEAGSAYHGYASLKVDGLEKIRPVDNVGGFDFSQATAFKFHYTDGVWVAYVATSDRTHEARPEEFFADVVELLKKF